MVKSLEFWDFHKIMSWIGGCRRCARPRGALLLQFDAYYEKQAYNKIKRPKRYITVQLISVCSCVGYIVSSYTLVRVA